ncbi:unnamed protein product [Anisakis simplex]|uniref:Ovule protein n=1 Tax=Anisakis simplex TaxID=6269 RepID=A0A0M3J7Y9_ANISI|nr:unnamed protein product [Anisakis simplex]
MIIGQEDAKCSNYRDLAVDILSVILPNSSLDDAFKFESLIEPLHASIVSQRFFCSVFILF